MSQKWIYYSSPQCLHLVNAHCSYPCTYDKWLLVAGGYGGRDLATVEVLNTSTNQWLSASQLPTPCSDMTFTIDKENWYLFTSCKQVFCVSLPDIVSQTVSKLPALWRRLLPNTPLTYTLPLLLSEASYWQWVAMTMVQEPTSISTSYRVKNGSRLETYLVHIAIVPVLCYPAVSCWLLEDARAMSKLLAESTWCGCSCCL